ncbi:hypothetical protein IWQ54_006156 [Labrenzia sp. EL_195]|nr:hypothetical protein [Labrenzia sp. EL_195]
MRHEPQKTAISSKNAVTAQMWHGSRITHSKLR